MYQRLKALVPIAIKRSLKNFATSVGLIRQAPEPPPPDPFSLVVSGAYAPKQAPSFDNPLRQAELNYNRSANPLSHLAILCETLLSAGYTPVSMQNFQAAPEQDLTVALRHDMDAYPPAALAMARLYAAMGMPSTFFLLHSAPYYLVETDDGLFRNPAITHWASSLALHGAEVGLHNDSLHLAKLLGVPATDILITELNFLRSLGIDVKGTVAHNSFAVGGAENFEIFKDFQTFRMPENCPEELARAVEAKRAELDLASIAMADLGLTYEGNFISGPGKADAATLAIMFDIEQSQITNAEWMELYFNNHVSMQRDYDADIWLIGRNTWVIADRATGFFHHGCGIKDVRDYLNSTDKGTKLVINLHPDYFV